MAMAKQPDKSKDAGLKGAQAPAGDSDYEIPKPQRRPGEGEQGLAITSLTDIMTIQLVFLIMSLTSDPLNVTVNSAMQLALSSAENAPKMDSIPIIVTKEKIIVDNKGVANLTCSIGKDPCDTTVFRDINFCETEPNKPEIGDICSKTFTLAVDKLHKERSDVNSMVIQSLLDALKDAVEQQMEQNRELGRKFKGTVTLVVDKEIPFRVLMEVIYTAGRVEVEGKGLSKFRMAIARNQ